MLAIGNQNHSKGKKVLIDIELVLNLVYTRNSIALRNKKFILSLLESKNHDFFMTNLDFQNIRNSLEVYGGESFAENSLIEITKQIKILDLTREDLQIARDILDCSFCHAVQVACLQENKVHKMLVESKQDYVSLQVEGTAQNVLEEQLFDIVDCKGIYEHRKLLPFRDWLQAYFDGWTTDMRNLFDISYLPRTISYAPRSLNYKDNNRVRVGKRYRFKTELSECVVILTLTIFPVTEKDTIPVEINLLSSYLEENIRDGVALKLVSSNGITLWASNEVNDIASKSIGVKLAIPSGKSFHAEIKYNGLAVETEDFIV